ncbi:hypothetical protein [Cohnella abietis]|uniref:Uncharacterized protein n=1 Tax=Cohnella abietis TaxID=2507935 RepID=A0A3T1D187_9BACL|nr:hypothetical protein [Cohnella abietis]BBI31856.1 hypothetical protein KCTCHS21_12550 [Cohnella abietis]
MKVRIDGIDGMTVTNIQDEVQQGGKFVVYTYCFSVILMTFKRSSDIYFVRYNESSVGKGMKYTLLSLLVGWWGIPWGPIYTIGALFTNLKGGKDVTEEVMNSIMEQVAS